MTLPLFTYCSFTLFQSEGPPTGEGVSFKLVYNKTKYDIEFPLDGTVKQLKEHLSSVISEYAWTNFMLYFVHQVNLECNQQLYLDARLKWELTEICMHKKRKLVC